ncbi:hypothetical protein B1H29_04595 [Streptomyces pactum]|uniref:Uncharacterized protein n=1 Tax=Streptomyces pactum TaxID=68249 RepID=A0A1S6J3I1_9ACTN|nr:hypothetical protein B1H29_04595 [Streptomyces pactum]
MPTAPDRGTPPPAAQPADTVVRVTIDRLVVHTTPAEPVVDAPAPERRSRLNLDEYLGRRP